LGPRDSLDNFGEEKHLLLLPQFETPQPSHYNDYAPPGFTDPDSYI